MSQMLPEGAEVMRRAACGEGCPAPLPNRSPSSENKELLRQQLLSATKHHQTSKQENSPPTKPKHSRNRQKNRWKLKFHHQALPQEYLDHYEQSLQKANATKQVQQKPKQVQVEKPVKTELSADNNNLTNDSFKAWTQRLAGLQNEITSHPGASMLPPIPGSVMNMAQHKIPNKTDIEKKKKQAPAIAPSKIITYDDLPYMGEMTLNNSKPRRGRKPKKADICHLIYENYGTVVPGQPAPTSDQKLNQLSMCPPYRNTENIVSPSVSKTDLQNKIISSLLERKLSQENKRRIDILTPRFAPDEPMPDAPVTIAGPLHSDNEPLNLCIRDLYELKLQIQKKFGNIYSSLPDIKDEPEPELLPEEESFNNEQPNAISVIQRNTNLTSPSTVSSSPEFPGHQRNMSPSSLSEPAQSSLPESDGKYPGSYVYWPNAGVYIHPLALQTQLLYYQRLAAAGQLPFPADNQERAISTPSSVGNDSISTDIISPPVDESKSKLVLKQISELLDPKVIQQVEDAKRSPDNLKMKRVSPNPPTQGPVKRKRSAIFIPPMTARTNTTTPTTEVSICKFKFTGGSKPSLQEKKMLSVDSGGNYRYYSGTGGKGNKGYDYLQRDSLQNRNPEPKIGPTSQLNIGVSNQQGPSNISVAKKDGELNKKKRKSRKSLQREKLEQTFKEKGFLIQTQQLQSAEGATYCKFRQLRKFTRYLFRSWKDYLPGELNERTNEPVPVGEHSSAAATNLEPVAGEWR